VVAALLSSSDAIKLKDFEGTPIAELLQTRNAPEKVHTLNFEEAQALSNDKDAFPQPYRTAFYAQKDDPAVMGSDEAPAEAEEKPARRAQWTKNNHKLPAERVELKEPVTNGGHTTFYAQASEDPLGSDEAPPEAEEKPARRAQWTKNNHKLPAERVELKEPVTNNGHTTFYGQTEDIGAGGQIKGVKAFVDGDPNELPYQWPRRETPYDANGSAPNAHPGALAKGSFVQKPDIGDKQIDEEVHGMASANNMVSPIPNWRKGSEYENNGWDPKAHAFS
jgi:hypothetical protein